MHGTKQLLFFEPHPLANIECIRRCLGRASQNVWVYSDQTSRCRCDLLSTGFAENCSGTKIFCYIFDL